MSTRAKVVSAVASAGILLIGWQAATNSREAVPVDSPEVTSVNPTAVPSTASPDGSTVRPAQRSESASAPAAPSSAAAASNSASRYADGSYTGAPGSNRFGSWTVTVTIADGRISEVSASTTANDSRSQSINARAAPALRAAVLETQGAQVNTISGATLTSGSYLESLQSALDQATA